VARQKIDVEPLLARGEVAEVFGVHPKTITQWAETGTLPTAFRTPGGHRRYRRADVEALRRRCATEDGGDP
jgi:excisionase family DNA binding protein